MDVTYAVAPIVVEATVAVEVIEGNFDGRITAHTSSVRKSLVLYDSKVPGDGHRPCSGPWSAAVRCGRQTAAMGPWYLESMVLWFNLVTVISYVVARIMDVAGCLAGFLRLRERAWDETVKRGDANEELLRLVREYVRLASEMRAPDFSGMIEADRATEAERLREEALEKAHRLQEAGDLEGQRREAEAQILDFNPKQKGIYYNRLCFVNVASFDLDEECKSLRIILSSTLFFA